jgi:23S rRNA pseudoU1915 N3-methylase RlmH
MSSNWLHKIQHHQTTPPKEVWENIASQLDTMDGATPLTFSEKLQTYELAPPDTVFNNIFNKLDEVIQETPPVYVKKIQEYTAVPPTTAWDNIKALLDKPAAKIINFEAVKNNRKVLYVRMATAAAVTGIIVMTIFLSKQKPASVTEEMVAVKAPKESATTANTGIDTMPPAVAEFNEKKNDVKEPIAYHPTNKVKKQQEQVLEPAYTTGNTVIALAENPAAANKEKLQNTSGDTPMDIGLMSTSNTYLSITGPDGQSVKVSSKFSNLLGYLNGNNEETLENLDIIISESAKWRTTFAAWRDKMTNNALAPTPFNFMDIIELSKVLEAK